MASQGTTTSLVDEVMKEVYEPGITNTTVEESELLDMFDQDMNIETDQTTGGKYIKTAHLFAPATGSGGRGEGGYIPEARAPKYKNALIPLKRIYGRVQMTGHVFDRVKNDEGAFINEAERIFPAMEETVRANIDRQLHGSGGGILARVNGIPAGAVITVDSMYGVTGLDSRPSVIFTENEQIVFSVAADGDPLRSAGSAQSAVIDGVGVDAKTLTLDALPTGVVDNDFIFLGDEADSDAPGAAGEDKEVMGMLGHVDGGVSPVLATYFNIPRANERYWNSYVHNISPAAPYTEDIALLVDDEMSVRGGGTTTDIIASRRALRGYWGDLKGDRRFTMGATDSRAMTGGREGLFIALGDKRVRLRTTRKMPDELLYHVDRSGFKRYHNVGWKWSDRTGSLWNIVVDGVGVKDEFFSWGYWEFETVNKTPAKCAKVTGIANA